MPRNRITLRRVLVATAAVAVLGLTAPGPSTAAPRDPVGHGNRELKAEYDEVLAEEQALTAKLAGVRAEREAAEQKLAELEQQLQDSRSKLLAAEVALDEANNLALLRQAEFEQAKAAEEAAVERLRQQAVASYIGGRADDGMLQAFANIQNGEQLGRAQAYGGAVLGNTDELVQALAAARAHRDQVKQEAEAAEAAATEARDEVATITAFLGAAQQNQVATVQKLAFSQAMEEQVLAEVQGRKVIIESRINAMSRESDGVGIYLAALQAGQPDYVPGEQPVTNPIPPYKVGSKFGMRHHPILNIERLHAGADMGAPTGTPIYAPADAYVAIASERGGYGLTVVLDHGNSLATLYAHQSQIVVRAGATVRRGELIGYVGSTGLSTGPHLHFETRIKGVPVDPESVVDFSLPEKPGDYAVELAERERREREAASRPGN